MHSIRPTHTLSEQQIAADDSDDTSKKFFVLVLAREVKVTDDEAVFRSRSCVVARRDARLQEADPWSPDGIDVPEWRC